MTRIDGGYFSILPGHSNQARRNPLSCSLPGPIRHRFRPGSEDCCSRLDLRLIAVIGARMWFEFDCNLHDLRWVGCSRHVHCWPLLLMGGVSWMEFSKRKRTAGRKGKNWFFLALAVGSFTTWCR